jgi:hypothetical protein
MASHSKSMVSEKLQILRSHLQKFRIVFWDVLPCKIIVYRRSTSQKTILNFILAAVRTLNLTHLQKLRNYRIVYYRNEVLSRISTYESFDAFCRSVTKEPSLCRYIIYKL